MMMMIKWWVFYILFNKMLPTWRVDAPRSCSWYGEMWLSWRLTWLTSRLRIKVRWKRINYTNECIADQELMGATGRRFVFTGTHQAAALFWVKWRYGRRLEIVALYRKGDSVCWCVFTWRIRLLNFLSFRVQTTELSVTLQEVFKYKYKC